MPTYDYECDACGHEFELFQGINDPHQRKCPKCGKLKLRRLFGTGAAVVFKGSGFYQTDYRSDSYKKAAEKDSKDKKASDGGGEKSSGESSAKDSGGKKDGEAKAKSSDSGAAEPNKKSSKKANGD
jgi:putative FmdB family regulatory protein